MSELPAPSAPSAAEITSDEKTFAMLAHLSAFVLSIVGPLVIYLIKKDESPYVAYHAMQALLYQVAVTVFVIVVGLPLVTCTFGLATPILLLPHILSVLHAVKANNGEWSGYPGLEAFGRE